MENLYMEETAFSGSRCLECNSDPQCSDDEFCMYFYYGLNELKELYISNRDKYDEIVHFMRQNYFTCQDRTGFGSRCYRDEVCEEGLVCVDLTNPYPGQNHLKVPGECGSFDRCYNYEFCVQKFGDTTFCDYDLSICRKKLNHGEECKDESYCSKDYFCATDYDYGDKSNTCVLKNGLGVWCGREEHCMDGLFCATEYDYGDKSNTCVKKNGLEVWCGRDEHCKDGLFCANVFDYGDRSNTCVKKNGFGVWCGRHEHCISNSCVDSICE